MRLSHYINESVADIKDIPYDCAEFMSVAKGSKKLLYRGSRNSFPHDITLVNRRVNRRPSATPIRIHDAFDKAFDDAFGWKARSTGVFAVGDDIDAENYGTVYIFIPIGPYFDFVWSPDIMDLFIELEDIAFDVSIDDIRNMVENYSNKNLKKAIQSGNEIMFNVDKYYMVNRKYEDEILDMLQ
jgi:hypothetical protein